MRDEPSWRPLTRRDLGVAASISDVIGAGVAEHPSVAGAIRRADNALFFSDTGGDHQRASHRAHAYLVVEPQSVHLWREAWKPLRGTLLRDQRRMSYVRLGDRRRGEALDGFLRVTQHLVGFVVVILIDKRQKLFAGDDAPDEFQHWKSKAFERLLTTTHLLSILLSGLTRERQDILWTSDEDDIAPNDARMWDVCDVVGRVSAHYLDHDLGHFRFATTKSDDGSRELEDLVAIPDLAAGCLAEVSASYRHLGATLSPNLVLPVPAALPPKAARLLRWITESSGGLRHIVVSVDPNEPASKFVVRRLAFTTN